MSQPFENLILNPAAFAPDRTEVDLSALGILMGEAGPDYGESSITVERVRQAIGEGVTDRRWASVECTVPLVLGTDLTMPLAEAVHRIEATAATIQRKGGGWIERRFADAGGFAGAVVCPVDAVGLSGLQGFMMGRGELAPEVVLKLSRYPIWYAAVEVPGTEVKASEVRDLKWEIAEMLGTAPGLIRVRVKNEGATDWRGAMACIESDYLSTAATADLAYECEKLTPLGGASVVEKTGASGGKVVEHASLTAGWLPILGSEISGVGHMTHTGTRRMKFRIFDPSPALGRVQLQLEWRALGSTSWSRNRVMEAPIIENWSLIDLGECRPELAILGSQRWEWRLMAQAPGGSGAIRLDRVWPMATEQMLVVSTPVTELIAEAQQANRLPEANAENDVANEGTATWTELEKVKAEDSVGALCTVTASNPSKFLKTKKHGFSLPAGAVPTGIVVAVRRLSTWLTHDAEIRLAKAGVISGENRANLSQWPSIGFGGEGFATVVYGSSSDLWGLSWTRADINAEGFGAAIAAKYTGTIENLIKIDCVKITVYYNFPEVVADENRVCFASRSMEFRLEGVQRQHPTAEVWAPLIPEAGSIFEAPPGGLEGRGARGIIVPSQGDLGVLPDAGAQKISILPSYRPGYLSAREAA